MITNPPVIDWLLCKKRANGDEAFATEMLTRIIQDLEKQLPRLKTLFLTQDYVTLAQAVHRLRGGLAYSGLPRLQASAEQLETTLKAPIMTDLPALFEQFEHDIAQIMIAYRQQREPMCA